MENKKPVKIIYDTDIGVDCDDAGTLLMLHRLCDRGDAELLAVTHCFATPYVAGCIDAINRFCKRQVPIGINYYFEGTSGGVYAKALTEKFPNSYPEKNYKTELSAPDTLTVLRKTLSEAEDKSITLVVTGALTSMAKLALSEPDEISSLSGKELIEKKILRTVVMGGRFFESWPMTIYPDGNENGAPVRWEWNIKGSGKSAAIACDNWQGELVFASYELGSYIKTMVNYPSRAKDGDPVAHAYFLHNGGAGRCSWDQTAMLEAVFPGKYWNYHKAGRVSVDGDFVTRWTPDETRKHTYLLPKEDYKVIRRDIDDIIDGKY